MQRLNGHRIFIQTVLGFDPRSVIYCEALGKLLNLSPVLTKKVKINKWCGLGGLEEIMPGKILSQHLDYLKHK